MNRNTSTKKQADRFILADNNFDNVIFIQKCEQVSVDDDADVIEDDYGKRVDIDKQDKSPNENIDAYYERNIFEELS